MFLLAVGSILVPAVACLFCLRWKLRMMATCRAELRPKAERIVIEKRWLERWSRSRSDFSRRWQAELRILYEVQVPQRCRLVFRIGDFERALDAELAGLLNREIESWTFADRASRSQAGFERVVAAGLERFGWTVGTGIGHAHRIVTAGRHRLAVLFHFDGSDAECLDVEAIARRARQTGCEAACIITNGRTGGAARAFADAFGVALLHCSQIDRLGEVQCGSGAFEADRFAVAA